MTLAEAIKAGQNACDAFSAAVTAAGYKSRWSEIDYDKHPELKAARDAHHAAGRDLQTAFEARPFHRLVTKRKQPNKRA